MSTLSSMMATNRRDRATKKFKSANERLMKDIPKSTHKEMAKLRITDLDTIPGDIETKAQHIQTLILSVVKAREDYKETRPRLEKATDTAGQWFVKSYPCLTALIEAGKETGRVFDPYGLVFSGLVVIATTSKGVIERAAQIEDPLDFLEKELRSIQVPKDVPSGLSSEQLAIARCSALELSAAISGFLACVIHDRLRSTPRRVVSTIFKGPPPIVQLQNEIIAAKDAYIDALTFVSGAIPGLPYTKDDTTPEAGGVISEGKAIDQETLTRRSTFTLVENEMQSTGTRGPYNEQAFHKWFQESFDAVERERRYHLTQLQSPSKPVPPSWIWDHPTFGSWLSSPNPVTTLCISAPAGFGKSVLSAYLTEELSNRYPNSQVGYFFCKQSVQLQEAHQVIRTLLFQITKGSPKAVGKVIEAWKCSEGVARNVVSAQEMCSCVFMTSLRELAEAGVEEVFLLIDGLDECPSDKFEEIITFIKLLQPLSIDTRIPRIRILLSVQSTVGVSYSLGLGAIPTVELDRDNDPCINEYISHYVGKLDPNSNLARGFSLSNIASPVTYFEWRHGGSFLWISTLFRCLKPLSPEHFTVYLNTCLPNDIYSIYRASLRHLERELHSEEIKSVKQILLWATISLRDLTISELEQAIILSKSKSTSDSPFNLRELLAKCASILHVTPDLPDQYATVTLTHSTFRKYITDEKKSPPLFHVCPQKAHAHATITCLSHLSTQMVGPPVTLFDPSLSPTLLSGRNASFVYAWWAFADHLERAAKFGMCPKDNEDIERVIRTFLEPEVLTRWITGIIVCMEVIGANDESIAVVLIGKVIGQISRWVEGHSGTLDEMNNDSPRKSLESFGTMDQDWLQGLQEGSLGLSVNESAFHVWLRSNPGYTHFPLNAFRLVTGLLPNSCSRDANRKITVLVETAKQEITANSSWRDANIGHALASDEVDVELLRQAKSYYLMSLNAVEECGVTEGLAIWSQLTKVSILLGERSPEDLDMGELLGMFQTLEKSSSQTFQLSVTLLNTILSMLKSLMWYNSRKGQSSSPLNIIIQFLQDTTNKSIRLMDSESTSIVPSLEWNTVELAEAQYRRYCEIGDISDLDNAFKILDQFSVSQNSERFLQSWGPIYSTVCLARYFLTGPADSLHSAIETCEKAFATCDSRDSRFAAAFMLPFVMALGARFEAEGSLSDLNRAILLASGASSSDSFAPKNDPALALALSETLRRRAKETGSSEDLQGSLAYAEGALTEGTIPTHPSYSAYLALAKHTIYQFNGSLSTLQEAITLFRTSLEHIQETAPFRCRAVYQFSFLLSDYFEHTGEIESLEECIELLRGCIQTAPDKERCLPNYLLSLSDALEKRYEYHQRSEDLDLALHYSQQSLDVNRQPWISNDFHSTRGRILLTKVTTSENCEDLKSAITHFRQSVELSSVRRGTAIQAIAYHELSKALRIQFEKTKEVGKIDESIDYARKALDMLPESRREKAEFEFEFARSLLTEYFVSGARDVLQQAGEVAQRALEGSEEDCVNRRRYSEFLAMVRKTTSVGGNTAKGIKAEESTAKNGGHSIDEDVPNDLVENVQVTQNWVDQDELAERRVKSEEGIQGEDAQQSSLSQNAVEDGPDRVDAIPTESPLQLETSSDETAQTTARVMTSEKERASVNQAEIDLAETTPEYAVARNVVPPKDVSEEVVEIVHEPASQEGIGTVWEEKIIPEQAVEELVEEVYPDIAELASEESNVESEKPVQQWAKETTARFEEGDIQVSKLPIPEEPIPTPNDDDRVQDEGVSISSPILHVHKPANAEQTPSKSISTPTFPDQILREEHPIPHEAISVEGSEEGTVPQNDVSEAAVEVGARELLSKDTSGKISPNAVVEGTKQVVVEGAMPLSTLSKELDPEQQIEEQRTPKQAVQEDVEDRKAVSELENFGYIGTNSLPENANTKEDTSAAHMRVVIGQQDDLAVASIPEDMVPTNQTENGNVSEVDKGTVVSASVLIVVAGHETEDDYSPVEEVVDLSREMRRAMSMSPWVFQGFVGCVLIIIWTYRRFREGE